MDQQTNNLVYASFKKLSGATTLKSLIFELTWNDYDSLPISPTTVEVPKSSLDNPANTAFTVALHSPRVPKLSGVYSWEVKAKIGYEVNGIRKDATIITRGETPVVVVNDKQAFGPGWALEGIPSLLIDARPGRGGGTSNDPTDDRAMLIFPGRKPTLFDASYLAIYTGYNGLLPSIAAGSQALSFKGTLDPSEFGTLESSDSSATLTYKDVDGTQYVFERYNWGDQKLYACVRIMQPGVTYNAAAWATASSRRGISLEWESPSNYNPNNPLPRKGLALTSSDGVTTNFVYQGDKVREINRKSGSNSVYQVDLVYADKLLKTVSLHRGGADIDERVLSYDANLHLISDQWNTIAGTLSKPTYVTSYNYGSNGFINTIEVGNLAPFIVTSAAQLAAASIDTPSWVGTVEQIVTDFKKYDPLNPNLPIDVGQVRFKSDYRFDKNGLLNEHRTFVNSATPDTTEKWEYNSFGDIARYIDPLGRITTNWYDYQRPADKDSTTDGTATDEHSEIVYDQNDYRGNVTIVAAPTGITRYFYETADSANDAVGKLVHIQKDPKFDSKSNGQTVTSDNELNTFYGYRVNGQMTYSQIVRGQRDAYPQQANAPFPVSNAAQNGRLDLVDVVEQFAYDANDFLQIHVAPDETKSTFTYDGNRRLSTKIDNDGSPLATKTTYVYDGSGFKDTATTITVTAPIVATTQIIDYNFDQLGNLVKQTVKSGGTPIAFGLVSDDDYSYDAMGNVIEHVDGESVVNLFTYNNANQLVKQVEASVASYQSRYTGTNLNVSKTTTFSYYGDGSPKEQHDDYGHTTHSYFDPVNRKSWEVLDGVSNGDHSLAASGAIGFKLDGKAVVETTHDAFGRLIETWDRLTGAKTTNAYGDIRVDLPSQVTERVNLGWDSSPWNLSNRVTKVGYDASGNVLSTIENERRQTIVQYDLLGRSTKVISRGLTGTPLFSSEFIYQTDPAGRVISQVENRRVPRTDMQTLTTKSTYGYSSATSTFADPLAGVEVGTSPASTVSSFDGNLTKVVSTDRTNLSSIAWYNSIGQLVKSRSPLSDTTLYSYDLAGQLTKQVLVPADGSPQKETIFSYDQLGRLRSTEERAGGLVLSTFTDYFKPTDAGADGWTVVQFATQAGAAQSANAKFQTTRVKTDALGNPIFVQQPDPDYLSVPTTPTTPTTFTNNTPTTLITYNYDAGNLLLATTTRLTIAANVMGDPFIDMNYDSARVSRSATSSSGQTLFTAVRMSNLDSLDGVQSNSLLDPGFVIQSRNTFDKFGNLLTTSVPDGGGGDPNANMKTSENQYDDLGRLVKQILPGGRFTEFEYDSIGNLTRSQDSLGQWTENKFDALNRQLESKSLASGLAPTPEAVAKWEYRGLTNIYTNRNGWVTTTTFNPSAWIPGAFFGLFPTYAAATVTERSVLGNEIHDKTTTLRSDGAMKSANDSLDSANALRDDFVSSVDAFYDQLGRASGTNSSFTFNHVQSPRIINQAELLPNGLAKTQSLSMDTEARNAAVAPTSQIVNNQNVYDALGRLVSVTQSFNQGKKGSWVGTYTPRDKQVLNTYNADSLTSSKRSEYDSAGYTHFLTANYEYRQDGLAKSVSFAHERFDFTANTLKTDIAKVSNEYYSNGQLKSVTREKTQQAQAPYKQLFEMQYDSNGPIATQTTSYPGTGWASSTENSPTAAPGDRVQGDLTFNYRYDAESNLVERVSVFAPKVIDDSDTTRINLVSTGLLGFSSESGRKSSSTSTAPLQQYAGDSVVATASVKFDEVQANVYDVWATWQEYSHLGSGTYTLAVSDDVTRQTLSPFKSLSRDEQTGFLRRSSEFLQGDEERIVANFYEPPNTGGNAGYVHSDGLPWFPIATVKLDPHSILKVRLENQVNGVRSGQIPVDGFKLTPHVSREVMAYDHANRLVESKLYTESLTTASVVSTFAYDVMGRQVVSSSNVVRTSAVTTTGVGYEGQLPVVRFDMKAATAGNIESFTLFDQQGAVIASDTSTTAHQPVLDHQLTTWQINNLDGSEFTNTETWFVTPYAFAGNRRVTVNSDPITQMQQSNRGMQQQHWDAETDRRWAAYNGIADPLHQVLDKVGLVDPIGIADGLNAVWYLGEGALGREGAFVNAGFSAMGLLLPYAGDLLKLGRAGAKAAEACGVLKQLPTEKLLLRGAGNAASGAASGAVIGGGVAYATGGDVWQGATQGALGGALGGFTRGFYMNRFAQACFAAGTPLVMDLDGNSKPIEDIQVGEFVLARDEFDPNGPLELKRVEELFTRVSPIVEIVIRGLVIGTSAEHPFYVPAKSAFIPAGQLQVGDELIGHDGSLSTVEAIRSTDQVVTVYNMRIADHHTYFVGGNDWGWNVWAHNACNPMEGASATITAGNDTVRVTSKQKIHAEIRGLSSLEAEGKLAGRNVVISDVTGRFPKVGERTVPMCAACRSDMFKPLINGGANSVAIPYTRGGKVIGQITIQSDRFMQAHKELKEVIQKYEGTQRYLKRSNEAWDILLTHGTLT